MSDAGNINGLKGLNFYLNKAGIDKSNLVDDSTNTNSLADIYNNTEGAGSAKDATKFVKEFCNTYQSEMSKLSYEELFAFQNIMQDSVSSLSGDVDSFELDDIVRLADILNSDDVNTRSLLDNDPNSKYSADEIAIFTSTYGITEDEAIAVLDDLHASEQTDSDDDTQVQVKTPPSSPVQTDGNAPITPINTHDTSDADDKQNNTTPADNKTPNANVTATLDSNQIHMLYGHSGDLFTSHFSALSDTEKAAQANSFAKIVFSGYDIFGNKAKEPMTKNMADSLALLQHCAEQNSTGGNSLSLIETFSPDDSSTDAYIAMFSSLMGTDKESEALDLLCSDLNKAMSSGSNFDTSHFISKLTQDSALSKKVDEAYSKKYPVGSTYDEKVKTITSTNNQYLALAVDGADDTKAKDIIDTLLTEAESDNSTNKGALEDFLKYYIEHSKGNSKYLKELLSNAQSFDKLYRALFKANGSHTEVYDLLGKLTKMFNITNKGTEQHPDDDGQTGADLIMSTPSKTKELDKYGSEYVVKSLQNLVDSGENVAERYEDETSNVGRHAGAAYAAKAIVDMIKNGDDTQKDEAVKLAAQLLFQCVDGKGTSEDLLCAIVSQCDKSILSEISAKFDKLYPHTTSGLEEYLLKDTSSDTENDKKLNAMIKDRFS